MKGYNDPNSTVIREQVAVDGKLYFYQKSKLRAVHAFMEKAPEDVKDAELKVNGEAVGTLNISEVGANKVVSSGLLDLVIPQGSIVEVSGASSMEGLVAEYVVMPDSDQTDEMTPRDSYKPMPMRHTAPVAPAV